MKSLYKIFHLLRPNQYWFCSFLFLLMLVGAALETVGVSAVLPLMTIMGNEAFLEEHPELSEAVAGFGIYSQNELVLAFAVVLIVVYVAKNAFMGFEAWMQIRFSMENQIFYARQMMGEYLLRPYLFHVNHNSAYLMRNVISGAYIVFGAVFAPLMTLLTECVTAMSVLLLLLLADPTASAAVAVVMGGMVLGIVKLFRRKITRQGIIINDCSTLYLKWVNQALGAVKETKIMRKEEFFLQEFSNAYGRYSKEQSGFNILNQMPRLLIETAVVSGLCLLIMAKTYMGESPKEILPLLGVLAVAAFRLMPSANRIVSLYNAIKLQMPLFHEIYPDMLAIRERAELREEKMLPEATEPLSFQKEICIKQVSFSYPNGKEILSDVSFVVPKGKFVGIMGPSGAGKTTFVDILLGLLPPSGGSIFVDGQDIQSNIRGWQGNLAYVPQEIYLIDASIKENIALGTAAANIDDARIGKVLKMAELYDFVQELPDGMNTMVGERGVRLSGGQRQRIGIARALFQEPEVLILDEATSALDNDTEKSITDTILKLKGQITIIAIAHRVTTLAECDFKVKFEEGRAVVI